MFWQGISAFLWDDVHILAAIGACCIVIMRRVEKRSHYALRLIASAVFISLMVMLVSVIRENSVYRGQWSYVKYVGIFFLFVGANLFCYKTSIFSALFGATVSYSLQNLVERLFEILRLYQTGMPMWLDRLLLCLCFAVAIWILMHMMGVVVRDSLENYENLDRRVMLFIASMTLGANIILDMGLRGSFSQLPMKEQNFLNLMSATVSLLTIIISLSHIRETEGKRREEIVTRLLHADQNRYEQERALHDAINIKCHDIRHQIAAMGESGYQQSMKEISKLVNVYDTNMETGNHALDIVLSGKQLACLDKQVTLTCMADGRRMGFIEDADIYALFGNILDNAIEAAMQMEDKDYRLVSMTVDVKDAFILIEEENYFSGSIQFEDGLPVTSKEDKVYHGFGMHSIRRLVEKYDGTFHISTEGNIYHLSIMIPIAQSSAA